MRHMHVQVNLQAVEQFIRVVGEKEDAIFQRRMRMLQRDKRRREQDRVLFLAVFNMHKSAFLHALMFAALSHVTRNQLCLQRSSPDVCPEVLVASVGYIVT